MIMIMMMMIMMMISYHPRNPRNPRNPYTHPCRTFVVAVLVFMCGCGMSFHIPTSSSSSMTMFRRSNPYLRSSSRSRLGFDPWSSSSSSSSRWKLLTLLKSSFDPDIPAGLRGEAVRNALSVDRGIVISYHDLGVELVRMKGAGARQFMNGKFTCFVSSQDDDYMMESLLRIYDGCWLTPKGRTRDLVRIMTVAEDEYYIMSNPIGVASSKRSGSNSESSSGGSSLYDELNRLVFPLDEVEISSCASSTSQMIGIHAPNQDRVTELLECIIPSVDFSGNEPSSFQPKNGNKVLTFSNGIMVAQGTQLSRFSSYGSKLFPFCVTVIVPTSTNDDFLSYSTSNVSLGDKMMDKLLEFETDDGCDPPLLIGELEYESLRIELGVCGRGFELVEDQKKNELRGGITGAGPLELNLGPFVDFTKGCYLGQEGVSAQVKNPRGPPRTLYRVAFPENDSIGEDDDENRSSANEPEVGDEILFGDENAYVRIGTITSIAEAGSTGEAFTVGLVLTKRPDSIASEISKVDFKPGNDDQRILTPFYSFNVADGAANDLEDFSIDDQLNNLEVFINHKNVRGRLLAIPEFLETISNIDEVSVKSDVIEVKSHDFVTEEDAESEEAIQKAIEEAEREAEIALAEAKRKAEKMEMLKKRAEAAMAARKKKRDESF